MDFFEYPGFSLDDEIEIGMEQYVFHQSYLRNISYDPLAASMKLVIEAYIGIEHPGMCGIMNDPADTECSKYYRLVEASFTGIQYFESIRSSRQGRIVCPEFDAIRSFELLSIKSRQPSIGYDHLSRRLSLTLEAEGASTALFLDDCEALDFAYFKSDSLAFLAGYAEMKLSELEYEDEE